MPDVADNDLEPWQPPQAQARPDDFEPWQPPASQVQPDDFEPWQPPQDVQPEAESPFWSGVREFAHGIAPTLAGAATGLYTGAAAGAAVTGPFAPVGAVVGGLAGGALGGYAAATAQEESLKALGFDDSHQRAVNAQANPWSSAIGAAAPAVLPFGVGAKVAPAARAVYGAITGGTEAASEYAQGEDLDPRKIGLAAGTGAALAQPRGFLASLEAAGARAGAGTGGRPAPAVAAAAVDDAANVRHGPAGADAAIGTAQPQSAPATGTVADPQNKVVVGSTGEKETGAENLNTDDQYGKRTPGATPGPGVNMASADNPIDVDIAQALAAVRAARPIKAPTEAPATPTEAPAPEAPPTPTEAPAVRAPEAPAAPAAPPSTDTVRFYHGSKGGEDPTSGGSRWVTPSEDYARNFRAIGQPNQVHYVDIPREQLGAGYDEINNIYRHFEAPEEIARQLKPLEPPQQAPATEAPITVGDRLKAREQAARAAAEPTVGDQLKERIKSFLADERGGVPVSRNAAPKEEPRGVEFLGKKLGWEPQRLGDNTVGFFPPTKIAIQNATGVSHEIADAVANYAQWHAGESIPEAIANLRQMAKQAPHNADIHNQRADILESLLKRPDVTAARPTVGEQLKAQQAERAAATPTVGDRLKRAAAAARRFWADERGGVPVSDKETPEEQEPPDFTRMSVRELMARGTDSNISDADHAAIVKELEQRQKLGKLSDQELRTRAADPQASKATQDAVLAEMQRRQADTLQGRPPPAPRNYPPPVPATKEDLQTGAWPALQRWLGVRASSTPSGRAARDIIMKAQGRSEQLRQIASSRFTDTMHALLNKTPPLEQRKLINYIQGGDSFPDYKPPAKALDVVDALRQTYAEFEREIKSLPEFEQQQFWDNNTYLTGQFKNPKAATGFFKTYAASGPKTAGGRGSLKAKKFATDEDARAAGHEPISTNPIERVLRYVDSMSNFISTRRQIQEGKDAGYIKYFAPEAVAGAGTPEPYVRGAPPDGWAPLNGAKDAGGRTAYAPTEFAHTFNNFHSAGLAQVIPREWLDGLRRVSNAYTQLELAGPMYHAFNTIHERFASALQVAISQLVSGDAAGAAKSFAKGLVSPITSVPLANRLHAIYLAGDDAAKLRGLNATPNEQAIVTAMRDANWKPFGISHTLDYETSTAASLWTSYTRGSLIPEFKAEYQRIFGERNIPAGLMFAPRLLGRAVQTISQPLFEYYIPRMKAAAAYENINAWLEKNPGATPDQLHDASVQILKNTDNFMGEMTHENMMMNKAARDVMGLVMRSPSFSIGGTIRGLAAGWTSLARGALKGQNRLSLTSPNYDPRASYALAYPLAIGLLSTVYQILKTGQPPDPEDLMNLLTGTPKTGGTQRGVGGRTIVPQRALMPGYHKDVVEYYRDIVQGSQGLSWPLQTLQGKQSGLLQSIEEQLANSQMTGYGPQPIVPPRATFAENVRARAQAALGKLAPISAKSAMQAQPEGSNISYPEQFMGIRQPGTWIADPKGWAASADKRALDAWQRAQKQEDAYRAARGLPPVPPRAIPPGP